MKIKIKRILSILLTLSIIINGCFVYVPEVKAAASKLQVTGASGETEGSHWTWTADQHADYAGNLLTFTKSGTYNLTTLSEQESETRIVINDNLNVKFVVSKFDLYCRPYDPAVTIGDNTTLTIEVSDAGNVFSAYRNGHSSFVGGTNSNIIMTGNGSITIGGGNSGNSIKIGGTLEVQSGTVIFLAENTGDKIVANSFQLSGGTVRIHEDNRTTINCTGDVKITGGELIISSRQTNVTRPLISCNSFLLENAFFAYSRTPDSSKVLIDSPSITIENSSALWRSPNSLSSEPKNKAGQPVYPVTLENVAGMTSVNVDGGSLSITGNHDKQNLTNLNDPNLCLFLPAGNHTITTNSNAGNATNNVTVNGSDQTVVFTNQWLTEPSIENWMVGTEPKEPTGKSSFGDITFTYSDSAMGTYTSTKPTTAGIWYMRASVPKKDAVPGGMTENASGYTALEKTSTFTINAAPDLVVESGKTLVYGDISNATNLKTTFGVTTASTGVVSYQYKKGGGAYQSFPTSGYLNAGDYTLKVSVAAADAYLADEKEVPFSINPKELVVSGLEAKDKIYDGNNSAIVSKTGSYAVTGVVGTQSAVEVDVTGFIGDNTTGTFPDKEVDIAGGVPVVKNVAITGLSLSGTQASNYTLTIPMDLKAKITPKDISFDISVLDKHYDGTTAINPQPTATLTGIVSGDESNVSLSIGAAAFTDSSIGTHSIIFYGYGLTGAAKDNYNLVLPTKTATINAGFTPVKGIHYTTSTPDGTNDWYKFNNFVITAAPGYRLSKSNTNAGPWHETITETTETAGQNVTFYVRRTGENDGAIYKNEISTQKSENYKRDVTAPTGMIEITENSWNIFLNWVTFGYFFKNTADVTITASDNLSGIASIEYLMSATSFSTADEIPTSGWQSYTTPFSINPNPNDKFALYTKITDNAGLISIINSDGIVVYQDSAGDTSNIIFTKTTTSDISASVSLKGNTFSKIMNGASELTYNTDYTISGDEISFKASYLDSLAAGDYTLTIHYNPAGETYIPGTSVGAAPATTTIALEVLKASQAPLTFDGLGDSYIYGDSEISLATNGGSGTGSVSYILTANDGAVTLLGDTLTILQPGEFTVKATKASDDNYYETSVIKTVTISKKVLTINAQIKDKKYDGLDIAEYETTPTLLGLVGADNVTLIPAIPKFASVAVGNDINIVFDPAFSINGVDGFKYTLTQPTATASIVPGFAPAKGTHYTISNPDGTDDWYKGDDFVITAADGYLVSENNTDAGPWSKTIVDSSDSAGKDVTFYAREIGSSEISIQMSEHYKRDTVTPTGEIKVAGNPWTNFLNWITFGYFFKNTINVNIDADDLLSGVASIEYLLSDTPFLTADDVPNTGWENYENAFSITAAQSEKFAIYVKITDHAGMVKIINSDGVVVYKDSEQDTENISFTKTSTDDIPAIVTLNGNSISKIMNGSQELVFDTDYTVLNANARNSFASNVNILFKASYLDSLAVGDYTFTIHYNPAGEPYTSGTSIGDAPATTTIKLAIGRANQVPLTFDGLADSYTYGDEPIILNTTGGSGTGAVSYALTANDGSVSLADNKLTIVKAGTFTIAATKANDGNYNETSVTKTIIINKKELSVDVAIKDKNYDGLDVAEYATTPTLVGLVASDVVDLTPGTPRFKTTSVGNDINIIFEPKFSISGTDAANYSLTQPSATANILPGFTAIKGTHYTVSPVGGMDISKGNLNGWYNAKAFRIIAKSGYEVSTKNTADDNNWSAELTYTAETPKDKSYAETFYVRRSGRATKEIAKNEISIAAIEEYKKDHTAPTGSITIGEVGTWKTFLGNINFNLLVKRVQVVRITSADGNSGVASTQYYKANRALSRQEVENLADTSWKSGSSFPTLRNEKLVVYAKITDKAGNITYLNSNGIVINSTVSKVPIAPSKLTHTPKTGDVSDNFELAGLLLSALTLALIMKNRKKVSNK